MAIHLLYVIFLFQPSRSLIYGEHFQNEESAMYYSKYSRSELDAQYNLRSAIPDFQRYFNHWERWSAHVRSHFQCRLDVAYGGTPAETLDIFLASRSNAPIHVFIHGGYWQAMDKRDFSYIAEGLVPAGITVVVLNYALAPSVGMDEIVSQTRDALAWIWCHAKEFGGDPLHLYISGHSAGGHLVAMMMATDWPDFIEGLPQDLVKGGCAISGLFDLEPIRHSYLNDVLEMDKEVAVRNSPIHYSPKLGAPLIISVGSLETEEYHRQSRDFARHWQAKRFPLEMVEMPGFHHFSVIEQLANPNSPLNQAVRRQMSV